MKMPETQIDPAAPTPGVDSASPVGSALDFDGLMEKYMPEPATPQPKTKAVTPAAPRATPETDPEEGEDTLAGDEGGVETGVDPDADTSEEPPQEDDELEALLLATEEPAEPETSKESFLPEFDRVKLLKEHPELEAPYKHMQAAFSKKTAEAARQLRKAEEVQAAAEQMQQDYNTFQESLKDDATFEDFLVQVALNRADVMERAYERAVSLNEDEGKKKDYLKERDLSEREKRVKDREALEAQQATQRRADEVINLTRRVAARLGLSGDGDLYVAEQFVANQILQNHANTGKRDVSPEQIVAAVRRAAKVLVQKQEEGRKVEKVTQKQEGLRKAQERVRSPARPPAPRPSAPAPAKPKQPVRTNAPKQSSIDSWLDEQLGVEA